MARIAHEIPRRPAIRLSPGDQVMAGERDSEWPEFVLVSSQRGEGWVPARHLSSAAGPATVVASYDTTELPTRAGDVLEVIEEDRISGWLWCRSREGREGWVPLKTVSPMD